ncbi:MAG: CDP-alcohol phosphatidyltransferase family protein [Alphaproteobacteria bacterium]
MSAASLISLARLGAAPIVAWLILAGHDTAAFWLFALAGLSDAIDGPLARALGRATVIGGYLDALADKTLLAGAFVALAVRGMVPPWLVVLVATRDVLIVAGAIARNINEHRPRMDPLRISKVNTAGQVVLAAVVLAERGLGLAVAPWADMLVWFVTATTLASGIAYLLAWIRRRRVEAAS